MSYPDKRLSRVSMDWKLYWVDLGRWLNKVALSRKLSRVDLG